MIENGSMLTIPVSSSSISFYNYQYIVFNSRNLLCAERKKKKKQKKKYGKGEKIHTNFSKNENHPQYLTRDSLHIHVSVSLG